MSNLYTWVIAQLECYSQHDGNNDVVFRVHWRRQATDSVHTVDICGAQNIAFNKDAPFTSYADLTFEQVSNWLEATIGETGVANLNAILDKQIDDLKAPLIVSPALPWA